MYIALSLAHELIDSRVTVSEASTYAPCIELKLSHANKYIDLMPTPACVVPNRLSKSIPNNLYKSRCCIAETNIIGESVTYRVRESPRRR